jgi:hypothetical protein
MNKKVPLAVLAGVLVVAAAAAFGYSAGVAAVREQFGVRGWVQVTVVRDGKVIYYHEGHNLITNQGKDFIAQQVGSSSPNSGQYTQWIGLSASSQDPAVNWQVLPGEINNGGLARAQGNYSYSSTMKQYDVTYTFTASQEFTGVRLAGLYWSSSGNTLFAAKNFSSVNLISGDQLTVKWTITIS